MLKQAGQSFGEWRRSWQENARLPFQCSREAKILAGQVLSASKLAIWIVENKIGQTKRT
ncbi:MAG: hypothetical protein IPJ94_27930 [Chloroflexi bacterium]|nr:hypothetical protein [Chloroflexota bacterium]